MVKDPQEALKNLNPSHDFFVGIDSDGCAFDTMEIKHKECFIPNIINEWELQAISKYVREAAEFVNLYSKWRGINRFPALVMTFDLLKERPQVIKRNVHLSDLASLRQFIDSGVALGNPALKEAVQTTSDKVLSRALKWSEEVNKSVARMVRGVPPFPYVKESLEKLWDKADIIVVSATPGEALVREWQEHAIASFTRIIAGQEMGSKTEHLALATRGKYKPDHILMIGDAPGDLKASRSNKALFFPINPGDEDRSWEKFYRDGLERFLNGTYKGEYEDGLIKEFEALLPSTPPWRR